MKIIMDETEVEEGVRYHAAEAVEVEIEQADVGVDVGAEI
jgi:hypothetical protein